MRLDSSNHRHIAVQRARRDLLDREASTTLSGVEPWIASSWHRCIALGKQPTDVIVFAPNALASQKRVSDEHHALIDAARPCLQNLGGLVAGIGYFALLTNAQGLVIDVAGAVDRSDPLAANIAQVGIDLSEESAGTSAICTALQEHHPVWLHQEEHFFEATSVYSCAGAPVFDPRGNCLGMLDLTGIRVREQRQLIHLVDQYAKEIEHAVLLREKHALLLRIFWPGQLADSAATGWLSVDESGQVIGCNRAARHMITELQHIKTEPLALSELFASPSGTLFDQARRGAAATEQPLWSGLSMMVEATLARSANAKTAHAIDSNKSIKAMQSELIQRALQRAKGNVELAALQLGISRATLYRKLRR